MVKNGLLINGFILVKLLRSLYKIIFLFNIMIYNFTIQNDNINLNIVTNTLMDLSKTHKLTHSGILIHVHGLGSHFQSTFDSMDSFTNRTNAFNSYISYGLELRGHGLSSGTRFMISDFDDYLSDLNCLVEYIKFFHSEPIYIIGQSMGGAIACKYTMKFPDIIKGIVLLSPMCGLSDNLKKSWYSIKTMMLLSYIIPSYKMLSIYNEHEMNYYNKYIESKKSCKYQNHDYVRLDTSRECYNTMLWLQENSYLLTVPVLALHSINDMVTSYKTTEEFINNCSSPDKTIILRTIGKHNLLGPLSEDDTSPVDVLEIIKKWLNSFLLI